MQGNPIIVAGVEDLVSEIKRRLADGCGLIGIDGWTGVGKSTLAAQLANLAEMKHFDCDDALDHDRGYYFDALRLQEITKQISDANGCLVVSGVCLLRVFRKLEVVPSVHVYMKRMASWGWADESELDGSLPEVEGASGIELRKELRSYHAEFQPHCSAHIEYQRLQ